MRVITLNDDEALIAYTKPIVNELRANMVHVDADFSTTCGVGAGVLSYGTMVVTATPALGWMFLQWLGR